MLFSPNSCSTCFFLLLFGPITLLHLPKTFSKFQLFLYDIQATPFPFLFFSQNKLTINVCFLCMSFLLLVIYFTIIMIVQISIGKLAVDAAIYIFLALFIGLSQAAGIGGGPILNICLMFGLSYGAKESMAITYLFLMGGSIASIYSNIGKRNKQDTKNIIDQSLVIMSLPMTVSGSVVGAIFNHFISEFIITIAFSILLSYLAFSSYLKYVALAREEQKRLLNKNMIELSEVSSIRSSQTDERLRQILKEQRKTFSNSTLINIAIMIALSILTLLVKGGQTFPSIIGLQGCGTASMLALVIQFIISYFYSKFFAVRQYQNDVYKQSLGFVFKKEEDKMSEKFFNRAQFLGFAAGFTGGVLGIGGAIILVPAWLEMGIDRDVATSSSAPLILSSALISTFVAALCGYYDSVLMVLSNLVWGFIASFYVKKLVNWVKETYHLQGIIFILLVIVMIMSLIFLLPFEIVKMISDPSAFFEFGHFC